jgi:hypothetical protein
MVKATRPSADSYLIGWRGVGIISIALSLLSLLIYLIIAKLEAANAISPEQSTFLNLIAIASISIAVPLTHGLSGRRRYRGVYNFFQPLVGGFEFILMQIIAWTLYSLVIITTLYLLIIGTRSVASYILASVGLAGVLAQCIIFLSLNYFTATTQEKKTAEKPEGRINWLRVYSGSGVVGILITGISIIISIILQSTAVSDVEHVRMLILTSILLSMPLSHILTGKRVHSEYKMFMPFMGGSTFVTLQAICWTLWTIALLFAFTILMGLVDQQSIGSIINSAGLTAVAAQGLLLISLKYFDSAMVSKILTAEKYLATAHQINQAKAKQRKGKKSIDTDMAVVGKLNSDYANQLSKRGSTADKLKFAEKLLQTQTPAIIVQEQNVCNSLAGLHWNQFTSAMKLYYSYIQLMSAREALLNVWDFFLISLIYFVPILGAIVSFLPLILVYFYNHVPYCTPTITAIVLLYSLTYINKPQHTGNWSWHSFRHNQTLWYQM